MQILSFLAMAGLILGTWGVALYAMLKTPRHAYVEGDKWFG